MKIELLAKHRVVLFLIVLVLLFAAFFVCYKPARFSKKKGALGDRITLGEMFRESVGKDRFEVGHEIVMIVKSLSDSMGTNFNEDAVVGYLGRPTYYEQRTNNTAKLEYLITDPKMSCLEGYILIETENRVVTLVKTRLIER